MCRELCDNGRGGYTTCQNCGRIICFDVENGDDIVRAAAVTSSGDLYCDQHAAMYDREIEVIEADEYFPDFDPFGDDE